MVYIYTPNGYIVSLIQTTKGNGSALEAAIWSREPDKTVYLANPEPTVDMDFMYGEDLVKLLIAVHKLPKQEMNH